MTAPTILDEIVQAKHRQLESQKAQLSLETIKDGLQHSDRDFFQALKSPSPAFILECKKTSPSKGLLRADFDLPAIASEYAMFASAISVLTEPEYFQGSLENLGIVRKHAPQPLICKDFLIDPYQVYQARHFGADAVLLILAILTDQQWREMYELAKSLNMDAITEVSNESEMIRARELEAPIVGINNRNLRDMSIDLNTTRELANQLPEDVLVISESGFYTNQQVRSMSDCSDGFLIGSSLMGHPNLAHAVKQIIFGDCKVCGLTRNEDALAADQAGAVYGGVIFAEASPRRVSVEQANAVWADTNLIRVGVFQNHDADEIVGIVRSCGLDVIQLHGDEDLGVIEQLSKELGDGIQYFKALTVGNLASADDWLAASDGVRILVDNRSEHVAGGTGEPFDWEQLPMIHREKMLVAGGVGPDNVAAAMRLGCCGVDMNSKLEIQPGVKSANLIRQAFEQIRNFRDDA